VAFLIEIVSLTKSKWGISYFCKTKSKLKIKMLAWKLHLEQNKIRALNAIVLITTLLSVYVHTEITTINHHPEHCTLFRAIILIAVSNDFHLLTVCVTERELLPRLQYILLKHPPKNSLCGLKSIKQAAWNFPRGTQQNFIQTDQHRRT
jgi:hypothetical protein